MEDDIDDASDWFNFEDGGDRDALISFVQKKLKKRYDQSNQNMKYDFSDSKYDSEYFLRLSIECRQNCGNLIKTANLILKVSGLRHSLLPRYTAFEELQKAIFCMLVHRGYMNKEQISIIFSKHESKIILFEKIFNSPVGLSIENQEFILDGIPLKQLDFKKIIDENKEFGQKYMEKRNDCLYVRPDKNGVYSPSTKSDFKEEQQRLISEISVLNGLWEILWKYDFKGKFWGFSCYRITSKGKRPMHDIHFNGGIPIERKNYRPDWAKDVDEQFVSMDKEIYYKNKKII